MSTSVRFFKTLNGVLTQGINGYSRARKINEYAAIELVRYYLGENTYAEARKQGQYFHRDGYMTGLVQAAGGLGKVRGQALKLGQVKA